MIRMEKRELWYHSCCMWKASKEDFFVALMNYPMNLLSFVYASCISYFHFVTRVVLVQLLARFVDEGTSSWCSKFLDCWACWVRFHRFHRFQSTRIYPCRTHIGACLSSRDRAISKAWRNRGRRVAQKQLSDLVTPRDMLCQFERCPLRHEIWYILNHIDTQAQVHAAFSTSRREKRGLACGFASH